MTSQKTVSELLSIAQGVNELSQLKTKTVRTLYDLNDLRTKLMDRLKPFEATRSQIISEFFDVKEQKFLEGKTQAEFEKVMGEALKVPITFTYNATLHWDAFIHKDVMIEPLKLVPLCLSGFMKVTLDIMPEKLTDTPAKCAEVQSRYLALGTRKMPASSRAVPKIIRTALDYFKHADEKATDTLTCEFWPLTIKELEDAVGGNPSLNELHAFVDEKTVKAYFERETEAEKDQELSSVKVGGEIE